MQNVSFKMIKDGNERSFIINKALTTIPGTGDIIVDPVDTKKFKVESVIHSNIFGSPGEHLVTVYIKEIE